ncbi:hypothetical protein C8F01DRAFT_799116, partial [Mycena amicta]
MSQALRGTSSRPPFHLSVSPQPLHLPHAPLSAPLLYNLPCSASGSSSLSAHPPTPPYTPRHNQQCSTPLAPSSRPTASCPTAVVVSTSLLPHPLRLHLPRPPSSSGSPSSSFPNPRRRSPCAGKPLRVPIRALFTTTRRCWRRLGHWLWVRYLCVGTGSPTGWCMPTSRRRWRGAQSPCVGAADHELHTYIILSSFRILCAHTYLRVMVLPSSLCICLSTIFRVPLLQLQCTTR